MKTNKMLNCGTIFATRKSPLRFLILCILLMVVAGCVSSNKHTTITVPELRLTTRQPYGEGSPILKRYFRGTKKIYDEYFDPAKGLVIGRSYYAGGQIVMVESDEDGDGFFETITFYPDDLQNMEVFRRHIDGSVTPMDSKELQELKQEIIRAFRTFKHAFEEALKDVQEKQLAK